MKVMMRDYLVPHVHNSDAQYSQYDLADHLWVLSAYQMIVVVISRNEQFVDARSNFICISNVNALPFLIITGTRDWSGFERFRYHRNMVYLMRCNFFRKLSRMMRFNVLTPIWLSWMPSLRCHAPRRTDRATTFRVSFVPYISAHPLASLAEDLPTWDWFLIVNIIGMVVMKHNIDI